MKIFSFMLIAVSCLTFDLRSVGNEKFVDWGYFEVRLVRRVPDRPVGEYWSGPTAGRLPTKNFYVRQDDLTQPIDQNGSSPRRYELGPDITKYVALGCIIIFGGGVAVGRYYAPK